MVAAGGLRKISVREIAGEIGKSHFPPSVAFRSAKACCRRRLLQTLLSRSESRHYCPNKTKRVIGELRHRLGQCLGLAKFAGRVVARTGKVGDGSPQFALVCRLFCGVLPCCGLHFLAAKSIDFKVNRRARHGCAFAGIGSPSAINAKRSNPSPPLHPCLRPCLKNVTFDVISLRSRCWYS